MNKEEYLIMTLNREQIKRIIYDNFTNRIVPLNDSSIKYIHRREWLN